MLCVREKSERQSKSEEIVRERKLQEQENVLGYRFFFLTLQNIVILLI